MFNKKQKAILLVYGLVVIPSLIWAQKSLEKISELDHFKAKEARQGIAVDEKHIYVIGTQQIGKYDKRTHKLVKHWQGAEDGPIIHLDSGVIFEGKLFCAHSNYPGIPMTSSVEIWDTKTLEHVGSHSFGIQFGSCTWIDRFNGSWWGTFAHYNKLKDKTGKGSEWTTVAQFDDLWQIVQTWVFPTQVYERFERMSNSGGSWGPDSLLYCTGHDLPELYAMRLPKMGSVLELVKIVPINIYGQGIAWDRTEPGMIYGIRKKNREVVISKYK
jgi:hypothetical protein